MSDKHRLRGSRDTYGAEGCMQSSDGVAQTDVRTHGRARQCTSLGIWGAIDVTKARLCLAHRSIARTGSPGPCLAISTDSRENQGRVEWMKICGAKIPLLESCVEEYEGDEDVKGQQHSTDTKELAIDRRTSWLEVLQNDIALDCELLDEPADAGLKSIREGRQGAAYLLPSSLRMSTVTLFLFRAMLRHQGLTPSTSSSRHTRSGSPTFGGSTLMTSAPKWLRWTTKLD